MGGNVSVPTHCLFLIMNASLQNKSVLPFVYSTQVTLGNTVGASNTGSISLAVDSFFEFWYFTASSSLDADDDTMPNNFTVKITDNSTGRQMSDLSIPQRMLFTPSNPFIRQMRPVLFPPNSTIRFDLTNTVASANIVDVGMIGYKLFNL